MANLLPQQHMRRVKRERVLRVSAVALLFVLGTTVLASVFLVPSLLLSRSKEEGVTSQVQLLDTFIKEREDSGVSATVRETKNELRRLSAVVNTTPASAVVSSLVATVGPGITVRSISYERAAGEGGQEGIVKVDGEASGRAVLLGFVKALERAGVFKQVNLPVSNLAARTDIGFSLTAAVVRQSE